MEKHVFSAVDRLLRNFFRQEEKGKEQRSYNAILSRELAILSPFPPHQSD